MWQAFAQGAFFGDDPFEVPKMLQMFAPDLRNHPVAWGDQSHQRGQFARVIGARLQDSRLMRSFQIKKAQGHANVIVEAGLGSEGGEPRFEQGCQQLLGGRLAVGPGHAEHGQ